MAKIVVLGRVVSESDASFDIPQGTTIQLWYDRGHGIPVGEGIFLWDHVEAVGGPCAGSLHDSEVESDPYLESHVFDGVPGVDLVVRPGVDGVADRLSMSGLLARLDEWGWSGDHEIHWVDCTGFYEWHASEETADSCEEESSDSVESAGQLWRAVDPSYDEDPAVRRELLDIKQKNRAAWNSGGDGVKQLFFQQMEDTRFTYVTTAGGGFSEHQDSMARPSSRVRCSGTLTVRTEGYRATVWGLSQFGEGQLSKVPFFDLADGMLREGAGDPPLPDSIRG
ncbi:hypothetical protein [Streptomyces sp. NPDC001594]|uniref:hypothetical protein n=1 Tax=Streptomyces sp. NPDC001594 TaxID=3364590 RepID=UPI0036931E33